MKLDTLGDFEFQNIASAALHNKVWWRQFLEPNVINRSRSALIELKVSLVSQIQDFADVRDVDWNDRTRHKMRVIDSRISQINRLIVEQNKTNSATVEAASRKYSGFAFSLAVALSESDSAFLLDEIYLGEIDARTWLEKREQIERRGA